MRPLLAPSLGGPLWVISRLRVVDWACPVYAHYRTFSAGVSRSAWCHKQASERRWASRFPRKRHWDYSDGMAETPGARLGKVAPLAKVICLLALSAIAGGLADGSGAYAKTQKTMTKEQVRVLTVFDTYRVTAGLETQWALPRWLSVPKRPFFLILAPAVRCCWRI
jgi:hypothetical protein